jgi:restriction system protein
MADVTLARTGELLRKLFQILLEQPEGLRGRDALARLKERVKMTEYEKGSYESTGGLRFDKIVLFATVDASKAGWLIKDKGQWTVTEQGKEALEQYLDPKEFYRRAKELYAEWRKREPKVSGPEETDIGEDDADGDKSTAVVFEQAQDQARTGIDQYLRAMPPFKFQDLVAGLLQAMGHHVAWVAPPGKDGGIDILAFGDALGIRPPRIKVQVKRYSQNISADTLRSFLGTLGDGEVGVFVTTSGFTRDAEDEARHKAKRPVTLVDGKNFIELLMKHYDDMEEEAKRLFPLKPIYFLAPQP